MADQSPPSTGIHNTKGLSLTNRMILKPFWKVASWWGMRRLTGYLQEGIRAYGATLAHFETSAPLVALTIDDGLSRGGPTTSMSKDLLELLNRYEATATFFVCTDYLQDQADDVACLVQNGHELGNHMQADRAYYYHRLEKEEFRKQLKAANQVLAELELQQQQQQQKDKNSNSAQTANFQQRWFRAPQGILTNDMSDVLEEEHMVHVLGDCYCDDWKFAQDMDDVQIIDDPQRCRDIMNEVGELMLSQAGTGSIAIFHMPERGFRQGTIYALERFLQGVHERGWKCRSLTDVQQQLRSEQVAQGADITGGSDN